MYKKLLILGVGGISSSSGKTTFISSLLKFFKKEVILNPPNISKFLKEKKRWGAIKYTKTDFYSSISDEIELLNQEGKDTYRYYDAGAEEVLWVKSPASELQEIMPFAIEKLSHLDAIIIEGNSAVSAISPDVIIFTSLNNISDIKPSSWDIFKKAHLCITTSQSPLMPYLKESSNCKVFIIEDFIDISSIDKIIKDIVEYIDSLLKPNQSFDVYELLKKYAKNNRISCYDARRIAEEINIPYFEVGKAANELKIKISNCQLGCF
ncbi:MAG: hypothetical protein N3A59_04200 [Thermodesulfovibrionales bacterium]|nr:hypothetical protein [Thermodesulfovibrionales bacterium]